ncbi:hypothetical protein LJR234_000378 [Mesorhizobium amorphae]|uniref:hypothetical protein n=1 Tax=Mesorhizobium amorphae TaxID=71433 RepID=UPI003ECFD407
MKLYALFGFAVRHRLDVSASPGFDAGTNSGAAGVLVKRAEATFNGHLKRASWCQLKLRGGAKRFCALHSPSRMLQLLKLG